MCIIFTGNAGSGFAVGSFKFFFDYVADIIVELERIRSKNLKNNVF